MRQGLSRLGFVAGAFAAGRAALAAVILLSRACVPERTPNENKDFVAFPDHPFWDALARWDSGWYDRVARLGYVKGAGQSDVAFFPAFPYLSRWLGPVLGGHFAAGLVVGNAAFVGGLWFLHAMAEAHAGPRAARRAVWLALAYPATLFFSAYYTEGLFLLSAAGALYFHERDRPIAAGLLGALAATTRAAGWMLLPAMIAGDRARGRWRVSAWLLVAAGAVLVLATLAVQVGDPLAFIRVQGSWDRGAATPWVVLTRAGPGPFMPWLDRAAALGLAWVAVVAWRRLGPAHGVFAAACLAFPLATGSAASMERYAASVPAVFLVLAIATERAWARWLLFTGFAALAVVQTALFVGWYWAG